MARYLKTSHGYNVEYYCDYCGRKDVRSRSHYERHKHHYCSRECHDAAKAGEYRICPVCGTEFYVSPGMYRETCSRECSSVYARQNREVRHCEICGEPFGVQPNNYDQRFCSYECFWESRRRRVQLVCKFCGREFEKRACEMGNGDKRGHFCQKECYWAWCAEHGDVAIETANTAKERPNGLERRFWEQHPELDYVGDGSLWIDVFYQGRWMKKNPDFILPNTNCLVELFGEYWHRDDHPDELIAAYAEQGYDCEVLWEYEVG